jgi:hypothetical protein
MLLTKLLFWRQSEPETQDERDAYGVIPEVPLIENPSDESPTVVEEDTDETEEEWDARRAYERVMHGRDIGDYPPKRT